jgi:hypothetical protein
MKKNVIRLTESDLENIVLKVMKSRMDEQISVGTIDRPDLNRTYSTSDKNFKEFEGKLAEKAQDKATTIQTFESQGFKKDESFTPLATQLYALSSVKGMTLKRNNETKIMSLEPGENYKKTTSSLKKLESMMDEVSLKVWETTNKVNPAFYLYIFSKSDGILATLSTVRKKLEVL